VPRRERRRSPKSSPNRSSERQRPATARKGRGSASNRGKPSALWERIDLAQVPVLWALALVMGVHLFFAATTYYPIPHTGGDNAGYLALGKSLLEGGAYLELWDPAEPLHTKYPPLFPLILAGMMALGAKTWGAFKVVPILSTTLAVGFSYLWARRQRGPVFALSLALVLSASTAVLYSSRWILSDPLFLALSMGTLWAFAPKVGSVDGAKVAADSQGDELLSGKDLGVGLLFVVLAYFTRSAGLPLVVAVALWLGVRKRWATLGVFSLVFSGPAAWWWLRAARKGRDYISEFWLVNPYAPDLGEASIGDLIFRVGTNAWDYVGDFIPAGLSGLTGMPAAVLGVVLMGLVLVGWIRRLRRGVELAEVFAFLYVGLILVWPSVWSGDRFALPLFPLVLFYAGEALVDGARRYFPRGERALVAMAALVILMPAVGVWWQESGNAKACRVAARSGGSLACYGSGVRDFGQIGRWAGGNLSKDAVVYSRKPRLFFAFSGVPSLVFPFTSDPGPFFELAKERGVTHLLRDSWDAATRAYVDPVILGFPQKFCGVAVIQGANNAQTHLLALRPLGAGSGAEPNQESVVIRNCAESVGVLNTPVAVENSMSIPMLVR